MGRMIDVTDRRDEADVVPWQLDEGPEDCKMGPLECYWPDCEKYGGTCQHVYIPERY